MELLQLALYFGTPLALATGAVKGLLKEEWVLFAVSYLLFNVTLFKWW